MRKRYTVDLARDERAELAALTRKGKGSARQVTRAHVLLHAAEGLTDADIAVAAHTSVPTVARIRNGGARKDKSRWEGIFCSTGDESHKVWLK